VRLLLAVFVLPVLACAPTPPRAEPKAAPNLTAESWYNPAVDELASLNREAESLLHAERFEDAATKITKGQTVQARLLEATKPTLAAMEAASDLDDLYGRMLMHNGRHGFARSVFQKNVVRWKTWKPQTADSERRWKAALQAVAECDRRL
jgi:hypothetical protein